MQSARDLLNPRPISISAAGSVEEAARMLSALDIRFLPVTDHRHRLVGTFSDRELWRAWERAGVRDPDQALKLPLEAVMNRDLVTLDPDADLAEIVDLMIDQNAPMVPVVDHGSRLVGVISYADVLRYLPVS